MASNKMTVTVGLTKDIAEVCHQLMQERDTLQTHLDLSAQAIDVVTAERDEARDWARRMMRERDALKARCVELEARLDIGYGNLADIEPPQFVKDARND